MKGKKPLDIQESINVLLTNYLSQSKSINNLFFWNQCNSKKKKLLHSFLKEELDSIEEKLYNQKKLVRQLLLDLTK